MSVCIWNEQLLYSQGIKNIHFWVTFHTHANSHCHPLGKWWSILLSLGTGNRRRWGNRYWKIVTLWSLWNFKVTWLFFKVLPVFLELLGTKSIWSVWKQSSFIWKKLGFRIKCDSGFVDLAISSRCLFQKCNSKCCVRPEDRELKPLWESHSDLRAAWTQIYQGVQDDDVFWCCLRNLNWLR